MLQQYSALLPGNVDFFSECVDIIQHTHITLLSATQLGVDAKIIRITFGDFSGAR